MMRLAAAAGGNYGRDDSRKSKGTSPISWIYRTDDSRNSKIDARQSERERLMMETFRDESDEDDELEQKAPEMGHMRATKPPVANDFDTTSEVTAHSTMPARYQGEARIVAPNVSKLSPHSAVEVRLQSTSECVAILCSVDVLKMRSGFFHDVLCEQESSKNSRGEESQEVNPNILWRDPVVVPENSPYEAAAYLESLHEGRALFRGEWNFCWARLSVTWVIEDLMLEYAAQIVQHMNKLATEIEHNHWRTNPSVLSGMRVAVFRKGSNPLPTIVTGVALECGSGVGYSKLRVAFDQEKSSRLPVPPLSPNSKINNLTSDTSAAHKGAGTNSVTVAAAGSPPFTPRNSKDLIFHHHALTPAALHMHTKPAAPGATPHQATLLSGGLTSPTGGTHKAETQAQAHRSIPPAVIGDVAEPFWVQPIQENSNWTDPDELFLTNVKRTITATDKKMFWEMARALIDLPELRIATHGSNIRSAQDLTRVLKRPEYRVLWTADAPQHLPKEVATELILSAYVVPLLGAGSADV